VSVAPAKWTKADVKRLRGAIDSWWLCNRPLSGPASEALLERASEVIAEHRVAIAIAGIRELRGIARDRAVEDRKTAEHFRQHPNVYGSHTPEMIARFETSAAEGDRSVNLADRLIARVEAEGLPPEVSGYDPIAEIRERYAALTRARA
jgi:hypothetical protein